VQVAGAGERFVRDRTEAGLGRCGCCTFVLHYLRRVRMRDHSLVRYDLRSETIARLGIRLSLGELQSACHQCRCGQR
jgi:hypothetical protein